MPLKLYMLLVGCRPKGRHTEQHDIFVGIGQSLADLKPSITAFWPGAGTIHIDAWREVNYVDGYAISVVPKQPEKQSENLPQLFFLNLGGYKAGEFEEFHYKMLHVATDKALAIKASMQTAFYKHTGFKGATSHIDDKYGVDVDDIFAIKDILPKDVKEQFSLQISTDFNSTIPDDPLHLGYLKWGNIV